MITAEEGSLQQREQKQGEHEANRHFFPSTSENCALMWRVCVKTNLHETVTQ